MLSNKISQKPIRQMTINDLAKVVREAATTSRGFAEKLVSEGVRTNITPAVLLRNKPGLADCFTKRGGLSKQGLEEFGDFPTVGRIKTIGALLRGFINEFK